MKPAKNWSGRVTRESNALDLDESRIVCLGHVDVDKAACEVMSRPYCDAGYTLMNGQCVSSARPGTHQ